MREFTKSVQRQAFKLISFYRENPVIAALDLLGVELAPIQAYILHEMWFKNYVVLVASRGVGKALRYNEVVRVKNGWKRICDIKPGDYVYGGDGKLAKVVMTSGIMDDLDFYRITFYDGRQIECCGDHLWKVTVQSGCTKNCVSGEYSYKVKSTAEMAASYYCFREGNTNAKRYYYSIPTPPILKEDDELYLSIDPYIIGVFISLGNSNKDYPEIVTPSRFVTSKVKNRLPDFLYLEMVGTFESNGSTYVRYKVKSHNDVSFRSMLKHYGLDGLSEEDMFVPYKYLVASDKARLETLQGIMDCLGRVKDNSYKCVKPTRLSPRVYEHRPGVRAGILELARSLGIGIAARKGKLNTIRFRTEIQLFTRPKKVILFEDTPPLHTLPRVSIINIEYIGKGKGCCIAVDNEDHTYITKDYIVTHNSFLQAVHACLTVLLYPGKRVGLIGSSFRQAKTMFNEVDRIYQMSPILQQASERKPINGTDMCLLKLKPAGRYSGTRIAAIPLGNDGGKIRGERFHAIAADEFAQIPEDIFNLVIKPMAATASDPIERAKRVARAKQLKKLGIETEDDEVANKIIMSSSGYYKANHMWGRMRYYWSRIKDGDKRYSVMQIPYWFMPEGFLDMTNIEEARETLPASLFEMEYCGMMVSDTDGFYKASLLEACTANSIDNFHTVRSSGNPDKDHVMAIDPARERDSFAILIFEVTGVNARIVYAKTFDKVSSIKTAKAIFELRDKFNLSRIIMDSQGGGTNIRDLLEEGIDNHRPILNIDEKSNYGRDGDLILELFYPSPKANTAANYTALSMLEHKRVWFPAPPQVSDAELEAVFDECVKLKQQIVSIVTVPLGGGYLKFMTSAAKGKKDLYSCFIMGCQKIQDLYKESFAVEEAEPLLEFGGVVRGTGVTSIDGYAPRQRPLIVPGVKIYG